MQWTIYLPLITHVLFLSMHEDFTQLRKEVQTIKSCLLLTPQSGLHQLSYELQLETGPLPFLYNRGNLAANLLIPMDLDQATLKIPLEHFSYYLPLALDYFIDTPATTVIEAFSIYENPYEAFSWLGDVATPIQLHPFILQAIHHIQCNLLQLVNIYTPVPTGNDLHEHPAPVGPPSSDQLLPFAYRYGTRFFSCFFLKLSRGPSEATASYQNLAQGRHAPLPPQTNGYAIAKAT